jgi:transcriptional regulator with XRE-family HTH domain
MQKSRQKSLQNQIRRYRHERGLRLRDVANLINQSSVAHIAHWEKGRKSPSLENCIRLALAIQCPIEILFSELFNQLKRDIYESKAKHKITLKYKCYHQTEEDSGN